MEPALCALAAAMETVGVDVWLLTEMGAVPLTYVTVPTLAVAPSAIPANFENCAEVM